MLQTVKMEGTAPEKDINPMGKSSAEVMHTERMVDEDLKSAEPPLSRAQIRRFMIKCDLRVLPMLGVIYAVSILDRINVSLLSHRLSNHWFTTYVDWVSECTGHGRRPQSRRWITLQHHPHAFLPFILPDRRPIQLHPDSGQPSLVAVLPHVRLGRHLDRNGFHEQLASHGLPSFPIGSV